MAIMHRTHLQAPLAECTASGFVPRTVSLSNHLRFLVTVTVVGQNCTLSTTTCCLLGMKLVDNSYSAPGQRHNRHFVEVMWVQATKPLL